MASVTRFHQRLVDYVTPQGVTVTRTTKGLLFRFPNGGTEMIHFTQSDYRATRNQRANFRRNGVLWPGDEQPGGKVTKPRASTIEHYRTALESITADRVTIRDLATVLTGITASGIAATAPGAMRALGWVEEFRKSRSERIWLRPLENPAEEVPDVLENLEVEPGDDDTGSTKAVDPIDREFLDTVDSWTVDLARFEDAPMASVIDVVTTLKAAGLAVELRVWRVKP